MKRILASLVVLAAFLPGDLWAQGAPSSKVQAARARERRASFQQPVPEPMPAPIAAGPQHDDFPMQSGAQPHGGDNFQDFDSFDNAGPQFGGPQFDNSAGGGGCDLDVCCKPFQLTAGFAVTLLKPFSANNVALTTTQSNGTSFSNSTDTSFSYDLQAGPRIWLEYVKPCGLGARATYWQLDTSTSPVAANPPANGFGSVSTPTFGSVDISTTIPGQRITAGSNLNLHAFDLEGTKGTTFGSWSLMAGAGLRYGWIDQSYQAQTRTAAGVLTGSIQYDHDFSGVGPTISFEARRQLGCNFLLFSSARGSILFGKATSNLTAGEDLDLQSAFTTRNSTDQDAVLPIGEIQLGCEWRPQLCGNCCDVFFRSAIEGQVWQDAGTASSTDGNLGLFGFNLAVGFSR